MFDKMSKCWNFPLQFILLAVIAFALASPIDDKSSLSSSSSSSKSTPDISTLPLKNDSSSKANSTYSSEVQSHPLHKREANSPPQVAAQLNGSNSQTSSNSSNVQKSNSQTSSTPLSVQKNQPSTSPYTRINREAQAPSTVKPSSNYNPASLYTNQPQKSQPIQPASSNPSAPRPLGQQISSQPILSQNSRVRRDAPRVTDQKSTAPQASSTQAQKSPISTQAKPVQQPAQPSQNSRKTRDAPRPADASTPASLNKNPQILPDVGTVKLTPGQLSKNNSRPVRDAPNPVEQSKIVPSAYQPAKSKDDSKSVDSVTATPPLIAKVPQQKRDTVPLQSSLNNQSPQFVHPVPVDQILKKPSTDSSSIGS